MSTALLQRAGALQLPFSSISIAGEQAPGACQIAAPCYGGPPAMLQWHRHRLAVTSNLKAGPGARSQDQVFLRRHFSSKARTGVIAAAEAGPGSVSASLATEEDGEEEDADYNEEEQRRDIAAIRNVSSLLFQTLALCLRWRCEGGMACAQEIIARWSGLFCRWKTFLP